MKKVKTWSVFVFTLILFLGFSSCKDEQLTQTSSNFAGTKDISLTKGNFSLQLSGNINEPNVQTANKTKGLINGSTSPGIPRFIYDLSTYQLPGKSILPSDPNYIKSLGGEVQKLAYLYITYEDSVSKQTYKSGLVVGCATYDPSTKKINIEADFNLVYNNNSLKEIDNKYVTVTGIVGGYTIPNSTKVFIKGPSNRIFHERIIAQNANGEDRYDQEFYPPAEIINQKCMVHKNHLAMKNLKVNLYGTILGFNIKNNFTELITTSSFKVKTNAFSVSGVLDLTQTDKNGHLIHLASDPKANTECKGVIERASKDRELITGALTSTGKELENFLYIRYILSRSLPLKSGQELNKDFVVYTWVMPNGYLEGNDKKLDKSNIQNICNEIYASLGIERSIGNEEGSAPYVSLNANQLTKRYTTNVNTYTDPIIQPRKSYVLTINVGKSDNGVPNLMFKRVLLGNMVCVDQTSGNSKIRVYDGRNLYRHPNFNYVFSRQMNMIEVYNPTNQTCDMTKYFLMGYSSYDPKTKRYQYITTHGTVANIDLEKIYNALMAPLSPRNQGGRKVELDKYNNDLSPAFIEANIAYFSNELNGMKNPAELSRIDNPDFHRYGAITFYEGASTMPKTEIESKLPELKTLRGGHSVVYMGPMCWYWTTFHNKDNPNNYKYSNWEAYYEPEYYDPMGDYKPKGDYEDSPKPFTGANWKEGYEDNKETTTFVAINDAFCNKSQQIVENAYKMEKDHGNHWLSGSEPSWDDLTQIRMGWPSMGSNAATLYNDNGGDNGGRLDMFDPYHYFSNQYSNYSKEDAPRWIPGIFGLSSGQGLLLVKMTRRATYEGSSSVPKIVWVPEIVDVTPLAKDSDGPDSQIAKNYYGYTGLVSNSQYFGGYHQPRTFGRDFKKYYYSVYMIKYAPRFYPSPDILNEGHTWILTKDRREPHWGGNFGEKTFPATNN